MAAANILYPAFLRGTPTIADLRAIQKRRVFPMAVIQKIQVVIQNGFLGRFLDVCNAIAYAHSRAVSPATSSASACAPNTSERPTSHKLFRLAESR